VQTLTERGLRAIAPSVVALAEAEGLEAHAESVRVRVRARTTARGGNDRDGTSGTVRGLVNPGGADSRDRASAQSRRRRD